VSPTLTTFLFELANFLLLVTALAWMLFRPVRAALDARQAADQEGRMAIEARERTLSEERAAFAADRVAFDGEIARMRTERLAAADAEAAAIVAHAREVADRERGRSQRMLAHLEHAQAERLATAVAATTRDAVARLLENLQDGDLDQALLRAACRRMEVAARPPGAVLVESARPLAEAARAAITTAAGPGAASIEFRVVPALGAGLRVTTAHGLVDASATGIAAHAERVLVEQLAGAEAAREAAR